MAFDSLLVLYTLMFALEMLANLIMLLKSFSCCVDSWDRAFPFLGQAGFQHAAESVEFYFYFFERGGLLLPDLLAASF